MTGSGASCGQGTHMFYVDDSGSEESGWIVYSWVGCRTGGWRSGLRSWLDLRDDLAERLGIPARYEIHATKFARGEGNPSATDPGWNRRKSHRWQVMREALAVIGTHPALSVGTVCRRTTARRKEFAVEKADVYRALVEHLDGRLRAGDDDGFVFMDGDGTDPSYRQAHRGLDLERRRLLEDPLFQGSHHNQWIQMADITAWSAFQGLKRAPSMAYAWDWYDDHLAGSDLNGGPLQV